MHILLKAVAMSLEVSCPAVTKLELKVFGKDNENFILFKFFFFPLSFFSK